MLKRYKITFGALLLVGFFTAQAAPSLNWGPCQGISDSEYSCARLTVPLNYNNPHPGNTWVEVIKYQQTGVSSNNVLLLNAGGPWIPMSTGLLAGFVNIFSVAAPAILQHFTLVGFDPRGGGQSQNLTCNTPLNKQLTDINFASAEGVSQAIQVYGQVATQCASQFNDFQNYMGTLNTARDMDQVRQALGVNQISYLGYSYGTQLGPLYLALYPQHVRAMVLDSNVPPSRDYQYFITQVAAANETTLNDFFKYCDSNSQCPIYPNAAAAYDEAVGILKVRSVPAGPSLQPLILPHFYSVVQSVLQSTSSDTLSLTPDSWNTLAQGLHDIDVNNNASLLEGIFEGGPGPVSNNYTNAAVVCSDFGNHPSPAQISQMAANLRVTTPRIGAYVAGSILAWCQAFPDESNTLPNLSYPQNTLPVLLLGNDDDPMTPLEFSQQLHQVIPNSNLITWTGPGHMIYLANEMPGTCVQDQVDNYLLNLTPPNQALCDDVINPTNLPLNPFRQNELKVQG